MEKNLGNEFREVMTECKELIMAGGRRRFFVRFGREGRCGACPGVPFGRPFDESLLRFVRKAGQVDGQDG